MAAGLIDRVAFFMAPLLLGRGAPDVLSLPAPAAVADGLRLADVTWQQIGSDLLVEGRPERRGKTDRAPGGR
jgi:riboflavin biosynthesis pyrimidine reductase